MAGFALAFDPKNSVQRLKSAVQDSIYSTVKPFLPYYLRPDDLSSTVKGQYTPDIFDALDFVPAGKVAALAGKLAPTAAMVINPKTIEKFKQAYQAAKNEIESDYRLMNIFHIMPQGLYDALAFLKVRHPRLYSKVTRFNNIHHTRADQLGAFVPEEDKIEFNLDLLHNARAAGQAEVAGHELTHLGQKYKNLPRSATRFVEYPPNISISREYFRSPHEIEAFKLGYKKAEEFSKVTGQPFEQMPAYLMNNYKAYVDLMESISKARKRLNLSEKMSGTKLTSKEWADYFGIALRSKKERKRIAEELAKKIYLPQETK